MRIVLAPDSFKENLTARQVCDALGRGLRQALPDVELVGIPMADGGEGTVQSLVDATGGELHAATVPGPLGDPVRATWGLLGDGVTAVLEMAQASGLPLVPGDRRDPRNASTRGTGQLLLAALEAGARRVVLGIGGSATNDAGAGFLQALGVRLLDASGTELAPGGAALAGLAHIDLAHLDPRVRQVELVVASDVTNPLCGPQGASAVYGPQKGADPATVAELDQALAHFAEVARRELRQDHAQTPGAGAAGGLGFALLAFTGATLRRGVDLVVELTGLREAVAGADLVVTGEGRLDRQTRYGKTPQGVADVARAAGVPVLAVAGGLGDGADELLDAGFAAVLPVLSRVAPLEQVLAEAEVNLERTGRSIGTLLRLGTGLPVTGTN